MLKQELRKDTLQNAGLSSEFPKGLLILAFSGNDQLFRRTGAHQIWEPFETGNICPF